MKSVNCTTPAPSSFRVWRVVVERGAVALRAVLVRNSGFVIPISFR